ncbi:MAG: Ig-like domain-containing protein, partial [Dysgonamonadaceae bacterium]|nr:Ig-like domain-containing protein [Dysgonamonadaceae bacterium]
GFGSYYGEHRKITLQNGVNPNLNASVREAYFGALPEIRIRMANAVTGISLDKTAAELNVGETLQLVATVSPADAINKNVTWRSSSEAIATVSDDGLVTAVAAGVAVVTARSESGGFEAECRITVSDLNGMGELNMRYSVYPNPFADYIVVSAIAGGQATIYDLSGQTVLSTNVKAGSNRIETSALGKGVYILRIGLKTVKLVK